MKSLRILTLIAALIVIAPMVSAADFGIRAGRFNEGDGEFVGAELVFDAGAIKINPNVEYSLEDDVTAGTANVDVTVDILNVATLTPYVGAGLGLSYADADSGSESDILGNVIGGVLLHLDFVQPYAQVKYVRVLQNEEGVDDDNFALTVGLRF